MKCKYTKKQIVDSINYYANSGKYSSKKVNNTIKRWTKTLADNQMLDEEELNEGILKNLAGKAADAFKAAKKASGRGLSALATKVHDAVFKNEGVEMFTDAIASMKKRKKDIKEEDVYIGVCIGKDVAYPVTGMEIIKRNIIFTVDVAAKGKADSAVNLAQLRDALKEAKIVKMTRNLDAITCMPYNEADNDASGLPIVDNNKVLSVKFDGNKTLIITFDESNATKDGEEASDKLFT